VLLGVLCQADWQQVAGQISLLPHYTVSPLPDKPFQWSTQADKVSRRACLLITPTHPTNTYRCCWVVQCCVRQVGGHTLEASQQLVASHLVTVCQPVNRPAGQQDSHSRQQCITRNPTLVQTAYQHTSSRRLCLRLDKIQPQSASVAFLLLSCQRKMCCIRKPQPKHDTHHTKCKTSQACKAPSIWTVACQ
jgi:hypothetical protein